ncbi:hypothetical protein GUJ93_ZPchr0014g46929 [Zizania palustris]|uniref:Uncharacterized protein n=1 Tax=Zizania palustris TaxID=103762 RepID=A0A8J5T8Y6_ZIZPA|nr:hypothetical protein GUJ93_ZPchr0014g46929 [Zizania palustris]
MRDGAWMRRGSEAGTAPRPVDHMGDDRRMRTEMGDGKWHGLPTTRRLGRVVAWPRGLLPLGKGPPGTGDDVSNVSRQAAGIAIPQVRQRCWSSGDWGGI